MAIKSDKWQYMVVRDILIVNKCVIKKGKRFEISIQSCDITGHKNYLFGLEVI